MNVTITEIYSSIQGEAAYAGYPCTFVRLTGCPLRCRWCDTAYGFEGGSSYSITEVLEKVGELGIQRVELTGGEPFAQEAGFKLAHALVDAGYDVMVETGGSVALEGLPDRLHIIMDLKCPGSGMSQHNNLENLSHLKASDEIKFVIADRSDFDWAMQVSSEHRLVERFNILFSPAFGLLAPDKLAKWIVETKLPIRLNLQQHKYIWHPRAKGV